MSPYMDLKCCHDGGADRRVGSGGAGEGGERKKTSEDAVKELKGGTSNANLPHRDREVFRIQNKDVRRLEGKKEGGSKGSGEKRRE